ncbi:hypothetical protein MMC21_004803 [Puttea exsequens]|nr:hypothetical protein [Puttea exsequens]
MPGAQLCTQDSSLTQLDKKVLLTKPWKDIELLTSLQSEKTFFVGDRPTGLDDYLKRVLLSMGYSATAVAKNHRKNSNVGASAKGPRGLSELCAVANLSQGRYYNNKHAVAWAKESITPIIESKMDHSEDDADDAGYPSIESIKGKSRVTVKQSASGALPRMRRPVTLLVPMVEFLERLVNALRAESMEMKLEYLIMHHFY